MNMASEEDIVRKALQPCEFKGAVKFPYKGDLDIIEVIKSRYPSATHLFLCNLDQRDTLGNPRLTSRQLRGIKVSTITRTGYCSSTTIEATWQQAFAIVEKGFVNLKIARYSIGETTT